MQINSATTSMDITPKAKSTGARRQIRGSSLLLGGRLLSMGINFVVQVLIVRYLSKADYGAFAYALSIVGLGESLATFGLDRAITRFIPIYEEQRDYRRLFGTIFLVVSTIVSLGLAIVLLLYSLQNLVAGWFIKDQLALSLLLVLIFLSPVQALDGLLLGMFAVFANPRSIFFRKYVLAPGLKLAVVLLLLLNQNDVFFLAIGYLVASILGVVIYTIVLWKVLRDQGLLQYFSLRQMSFPWREIFLFTIPLLTSDLVYIVMNTMDAVLLQYFGSSVDVAAFRAVQPTAKLNQIVLSSFALLFTPAAARLFANDDRAGINNLYWQNAAWTAVCSFPVFILTFSLAQPITVFLYGTRYEGSAIILALLSLGYYFNAALGQNGLTLKVYGKLRYIVTLNLLAMLTNLAINLLLIPRYGPLGAALGTCGTLIAHNILKQMGLRLGTGINLFEWRYLKFYLIIAATALGLWLIQLLTSAPVYISITLAGVASLLVLRLNRRLLNVSQTFPELLRLPLMRRVLD